MIKSKKDTGSYYTPKIITDFICNKLFSGLKNKKNIKILEPSVGNGAFLKSLAEFKLSAEVIAVELNKVELTKAQATIGTKNCEFIQGDFINYKPDTRFSFVIGNPPYISKKKLTKDQVEAIKKIHGDLNLSESTVKNIWVTFLVKSTKILKDDGVLAFVLPAELLQISYAKEIREFIKREFERIEIYTFDDLLFDCKGQDTITLLGYKKAKDKGEFFCRIQSKEKIKQSSKNLKRNKTLSESEIKWSHHFLKKTELDLLINISNSIKKIEDFCTSKPGIVTAANKYFIVDKDTETKNELEKHTIPIIEKALHINGGVIFGHEEFEKLEKSHIPTRMLKVTNMNLLTDKAKRYIKQGEELGIHNRYKCKARKQWYSIPNIADRPEAFFLRRSYYYPKLIRNDANVYITDSAYKIKVNSEIDLNSFIYSFYNSLTLAYVELYGRYYGGGVLELTPKEFKNIPIPYTKITKRKFNHFTKTFNSRDNIDEVLTQNDKYLLIDKLGLTLNKVNVIRKIKDNLIKKRMRE